MIKCKNNYSFNKLTQGILVISAENAYKIKLTWEIIWKKDFYIENNYQFDIFCISRLKFHWKSFCDSYGKCSSHKTDLRYYMKKNIIEEAHLTNSQGFLVISAENGHKIKLIWEITLKKDIWAILPRVGKICDLWSKTRNTFSVIATKLHYQISWLMSLCKRNNPFVMKNVWKLSWNFFKSLN